MIRCLGYSFSGNNFWTDKKASEDVFEASRFCTGYEHVTPSGTDFVAITTATDESPGFFVAFSAPISIKKTAKPVACYKPRRPFVFSPPDKWNRLAARHLRCHFQLDRTVFFQYFAIRCRTPLITWLYYIFMSLPTVTLVPCWIR